jgi:hypothetical protein
MSGSPGLVWMRQRCSATGANVWPRLPDPLRLLGDRDDPHEALQDGAQIEASVEPVLHLGS